MRVNIDRFGPIVLQAGSRRHLKLHRQPFRRLLREGATAFPQMSPTQLNKIKIASISRYDSPHFRFARRSSGRQANRLWGRCEGAFNDRTSSSLEKRTPKTWQHIAGKTKGATIMILAIHWLLIMTAAACLYKACPFIQAMGRKSAFS